MVACRRLRAVPGRGTLVLPDSAAHQRGRGERNQPSDRLAFSAMCWSSASSDDFRMSQGKAIAHLEGKNVVEPSPYTCAALSYLQHAEPAAHEASVQE